MKPKKPKAIVLFSGGLDSRLVIKILEEQLGKESIIALMFKLPFGSKYEKNMDQSLEFCKKQGIKSEVIDCTKGQLLQEYLDIIKKPVYGHGTCVNACIDCKIFILKKAKEYAGKQKPKIQIIATGEVLGERPMSQHKRALEIIEEQSGLKGNLLRPLSAKLMPETLAEKKGLVNREKLFDIQGRKRGMQISLAQKYKIDFPNAGGGCLLCEPGFCEKLRPLLKTKLEDIDVELLKVGRHFQNSNIVIGKNEQEKLKLEEIQKKFMQGIILVPEEPGPTAFVKSKKYLAEAKELIRKYSKHKIEEIKERS